MIYLFIPDNPIYQKLRFVLDLFGCAEGIRSTFFWTLGGYAFAIRILPRLTRRGGFSRRVDRRTTSQQNP
jgi:hypothetical protein